VFGGHYITAFTLAEKQSALPGLGNRLLEDQMKTKSLSLLGFCVVVWCPVVFAQSETAPGNFRGRTAITWAKPRGLKGAKPPAAAPVQTTIHANDSEARSLKISTNSYPPDVYSPLKSLPLWTFDVKASRDGHHHLGTMVGHDPFKNPGTDNIPTYIVPVIFRTHTVATAWDPTTGVFTTEPGETTTDPTKPDNSCMAGPNNIALKVTEQSPVFVPAHFVFGGTDVGTTQYLDAFQRANFWQVLSKNMGSNEYHVLLNPVETVEPIFLDVPANEGLAIRDPNFFLASLGFTFCAPLLIIDINWYDSYLNGTAIPKLGQAGVDASTFPIFQNYNAAFSSPVTNLFFCCAIGYHSFTGYPITTQTYAVVDFDSTGFFGGPPTGLQTLVLSHEVGEWVNDPHLVNNTVSWGNAGQVSGCSESLEVGDPLTGLALPPVVMPNGYGYVLQELAFFSWFSGAPAVGANGWFSNNGTFKTDAGRVCP